MGAGIVGTGSIVTLVVGPGRALYSTSIRTANEATLKQNFLLMREAVDQYHTDTNRYPAKLEALMDAKYLRAVPRDPLTNSAGTWMLEISTRETGVPQTTAGVFDVKSGSEQTAIDGSRYANW